MPYRYVSSIVSALCVYLAAMSLDSYLVIDAKAELETVTLRAEVDRLRAVEKVKEERSLLTTGRKPSPQAYYLYTQRVVLVVAMQLQPRGVSRV